MSPRIPLSPRIRRSPYYEATLRHGATQFSVYNGMYLPMGYADGETEFWNLVRGVTLWDVAVQRIVEITGPDALAFTNRLTPRDVTRCAVGQCMYVVVTAEDGGILNDPLLLRLGDNRFWLSRADGDLLSWARGVAVHAGLDVNVREPDTSPLQVQGPKSGAVMRDLFGARIGELAYFRLTQTELEGIPLVVSRTGWSAELGYELYPRESRRAEELWEAVMAAGKPHGIAPAAPSRIRRIEAGILDYGVDMTTEENPFEIGLDWMVNPKPEQPEFIGKAALLKIRREGISRKLVGIEIGGEPLAYNERPWPVTAEVEKNPQPVKEPVWEPDGERIAGATGKVTSCIHSPRLKKNIGYAMLALPHTSLGTRLTVETPQGPRAALVVEKPFFDPRKTIPKTNPPF